MSFQGFHHCSFGICFLVKSWVDFARPNLPFCQRISDACRLTVGKQSMDDLRLNETGKRPSLRRVKAENVSERLQVAEAVLPEHQQLCSSQERIEAGCCRKRTDVENIDVFFACAVYRLFLKSGYIEMLL